MPNWKLEPSSRPRSVERIHSSASCSAYVGLHQSIQRLISTRDSSTARNTASASRISKGRMSTLALSSASMPKTKPRLRFRSLAVEQANGPPRHRAAKARRAPQLRLPRATAQRDAVSLRLAVHRALVDNDPLTKLDIRQCPASRRYDTPLSAA